MTTDVPLEGKPADFILRTLLASGRVGDAVRAVAGAAANDDDEEEGNALLDGMCGMGRPEPTGINNTHAPHTHNTYSHLFTHPPPKQTDQTASNNSHRRQRRRRLRAGGAGAGPHPDVAARGRGAAGGEQPNSLILVWIVCVCDSIESHTNTHEHHQTHPPTLNK